MHGIRKSNRGAMYPVLVFGAFEADGYGIIGEEVRYESVACYTHLCKFIIPIYWYNG